MKCVSVLKPPQNTREQKHGGNMVEIQNLIIKISYRISEISSLFAPPARRKAQEHAEMPKVWPVHDEV